MTQNATAKKIYTEEEIASIMAGNKPEGMNSRTYYAFRYRHNKKAGNVGNNEPKYTEEEIASILAGNKPEGMSNTVYYGLRYRYNRKAKIAAEKAKRDAKNARRRELRAMKKLAAA